MEKYSFEINEIRDRVFIIPDIKSLVFEIVNQLKLEVVPHCDPSHLSKLLCQGNSINTINYYQACLGASHYVVQFILKEGYTQESAKRLGCAMWNYMNKSKFFIIDPKKLVVNHEDDDDECDEILLLEKMCRIHHKRCDYNEIKHMTFVSSKKIRPYTFWTCFDAALLTIKATLPLNQTLINNALRKWNKDTKCNFFKFLIV